MTAYDFDAVRDRRGTDSLKWDVAEGELPCWVADMDFETAPAVREALARRVEHGVFGYAVVPEGWHDAYRGWWRDRHGASFERDQLVFCTGVVPALSSIVRSMTRPGDKVIVQTPVYNIFFNSIVNNGRFVLESPLAYRGGAYGMDFDDLERKMADPRASMMILCNPHNPVGKVWDRPTLARVGELAWKHDVLVVPDEIHCDLTAPGVRYVPFASASPACELNSVTCIAPTKAFNLAGIQTAAVAVPNGAVRRQVERGLNADEVAEPNVFACVAAEAAFRRGGPWLDALREYLFENRRVAEERLREEAPSLRPVAAEATYLMWIDCTALCSDAGSLARFVRARTGLVLCAGEDYGEAGRGFLRMNFACPRSVLDDALARLAEGVAAYAAVSPREAESQSA